MRSVAAAQTVTQTATGTAVPTPTPIICGNGLVESGEDCDDGNAFNGDGCDANCTTSAACNYTHAGTPMEVFVGNCSVPSQPDIAGAIAAAADGDIVTLCPGTYTTPVVIDREITLRASASGAATLHVATGPAIAVQRSGVRIEGLVVQADNGAAISADEICPLGLTSCGTAYQGSNLTVSGNTISNGPIGITWTRRIDCATVSGNTLTQMGAAIVLDQQAGAPAMLVRVQSNVADGSGSSGRLIRVAGFGPTVALNTVTNSATSGIEVGAVPSGVSVRITENNIRYNGEGITIRAGASSTKLDLNNITNIKDGNRYVGLGNEAAEGTLDAEANWWNSNAGPHHVSHIINVMYAMEIQDRGGQTDFTEFLCAPAPTGDLSVDGVCDNLVTAEVSFVAFGREPDVSPNGRFIPFVSDRDQNGDQKLGSTGNQDHGDEVFVLNRTPGGKPATYCLGGTNPGEQCTRPQTCLGSDADPFVLKGTCALITQASNEESGNAKSFTPRVTVNGNIAFVSSADLVGENGDGSAELYQWRRSDFRRAPDPVNPNSAVKALSGRDFPSLTPSTRPSEDPSVSGNGRFAYVESEADPVGTNSDHNREIFWVDMRERSWKQVTNTVGVENRRPATTGAGRQVLFDSTSDFTGGNADGNRELFLAELRNDAWIFTQVTSSLPPDETWAGGLARRGRIAVFSSTADLRVGENSDHNREIFIIDKGVVEQLTHSVGAVESVNPQVNGFGRFVVFESTAAILPVDVGRTNRRVYQIDRRRNRTLQLSRSQFGDNFVPRISKGRFVVWESTANLTGENPDGDHVIYLFDRRRDD